jgi:hypothetical protein
MDKKICRSPKINECIDISGKCQFINFVVDKICKLAADNRCSYLQKNYCYDPLIYRC